MKVYFPTQALRVCKSIALIVSLYIVGYSSLLQIPPQGDPTGIRAVIVGVAKYPQLPGGQQLQFADRDAIAFADALKAIGVSGDHIRLLVGADATTTAIKSAIGNWLAQEVSESGTAIIFFSGHGFVERKFSEAYLLGYDSEVKDPYSTALSVSELQQALTKRVRAGKTLLLADAMRRDFFDPENEPLAAGSFTHAFAQLTAQRNGAAVILANGPGEFSREGQRWNGHGAFTSHLLDAMSASATGRRADDLFNRLSTALNEDTSGRQHAWRSGADSLAQIAFPAPVQQPIAGSTTRQPESPAREAVRPPPTHRDEQVSKSAPASAAKTPSVAGGTTKASAGGAPTVSRTEVAETNASKAAPGRVTNERMPNTRTPSPGTPGAPEAAQPPATVPKTSTASSIHKPEAAVSPSRSSAGAATRTPPTARVAVPDPSAPSAPARAPAYPESPPPPRPVAAPPATGKLDVDPGSKPDSVLTTAPPAGNAVSPGGAPSPLLFQLEAAISSNNLIEPRGASAWDLYQRLTVESGNTAELARLKPLLAEALLARGRAVVTADVRSDNIADRLDELKKAGEMLSRARTLNAAVDISQLEKLRAALALIGLQFFDEAERALTPLEGSGMAAVENAFGLVYQGKYDSVRAERAFKRAIELDPKLAAPHYNLALLYRSAQKEAAVGEFETAASLDATNVALLVALGDEHFSRQHWQQAADAYRAAVKLRPSDEELHTKLGHSLFSQGLTEEANREYQRANELRRRQ